MHVEAGLRTYNISSPYPEEFNRQAVGIVSRYNFAPTRRAAENLIREGKDPETIFITGNTVIDAMRYTVKENYTHPELEWVGDRKLIFITAHRRENLGEPMHHMFRAIRSVLDEHPECRAVYPIHMNPSVRKVAAEELENCDSIHLIEPIDVLDCHNFEARCHLCLTDSGGIQECVTPPSVRKALNPVCCVWSGRTRRKSAGTSGSCLRTRRPTMPWRMPATPTGTDLPPGASLIYLKPENTNRGQPDNRLAARHRRTGF